MSAERRARVVGLSVAVPRTVLANDEIARVPITRQGLQTAFAGADPTRSDDERIFREEQARYGGDPFAGTVLRHRLADDRPSSALALAAAREALAIADVAPGQVDLLLSVSVPSDRVWPGDSAQLAHALGIDAAAWNVEAWNAGALSAWITADALIASGRIRRALIAVACVNSRIAEPGDSFGWFLGDAGAALLLDGQATGGPTLTASGMRANHVARDAFAVDVAADPPRLRVRARPETGAELVGSNFESLRGALAGLTTTPDLVVAYAPTAWLAATAARIYGWPPERVLDVHPRYANIGPALPLVGLHEAAAGDRLRPGDAVLAYALGPSSGVAAIELRWEDVPLGRVVV
jgi:3-oxoacyl-[acyl-carrier-protein] synthase III